MVKSEELAVMKAVALCYKPYLKPEEALMYCNLGRTQYAKKCQEYGVFKSESGYLKKEELDRMMAGILPRDRRAGDRSVFHKSK